MAVLRRDQRMDWLDLTVRKDELLQPLPAGSFKVARLRERHAQDALAF
jgi:putative SOS response-associated peptidase YedK